MKLLISLLALCLAAPLAAAAEPAAPAEPAPNTLSDKERQDGWKLLWDGKTPDGWRSASSDKFPARGWEIKDGVLTVLGHVGGDIITRERYSSYELQVDFKVTPGANSGIKYLVQTVTGKNGRVAVQGFEYQILDDERHPDAHAGHNGDHCLAALYDLIPASADKKPSPVGEWNRARILVRGQHVEHWLNDQKVVEYERNSDDLHKRIAASKFKSIPQFGQWPDGFILLQDHGNQASFRNIKIRVLEVKS